VNPDQLAELEQERRFLLTSLRDLEREHQFGDVDDVDYRTLREGYTARAAAVMRAIEDGKAALPAPPRQRLWRRLATFVAVLVVAGAAGVLVAQSSGQRLPGQELTGSIPGDVSGQLAQARMVLGTDPVAAQNLYTQVLSERPNHPEALAYSGWLLALNSMGASEELFEAALQTSRGLLVRATESDPNYADPHCFMAIIAARIQPEPDQVAGHAERCLERNPPADMRGLLEVLVLSGDPEEDPDGNR
jgi:hypothetical protein